MLLMSVVMLAVALVAAGCGEPPGRCGDRKVDKASLMDPQGAAMQEQAPAEFKVLFETSAGDFTVEVKRQLAPRGADRFYNLVRRGFFDEQRFFRVVPGFVVQWGMHGDPEITAKWHEASIPDDPVNASNERGTLSFAAAQTPNSRTTQVFVNLGNNTNLDGLGFAPFGRVVQGLEVVQAIDSEYGEQPNQQLIYAHGNQYLKTRFAHLDYIKAACLID
jgi:peptidyl-prolyl cis-trans isomerase A (cyclophilin A)